MPTNLKFMIFRRANVKIKKVFEKYDGIFDELIKNVEKTKKKELEEREETTGYLKKKIKKMEKFLSSKMKYFDIQPVIMKIQGDIEKIGFSNDKGFYILNGTHKNFSLRQCLGLFKNHESYFTAAKYVVDHAEEMFEAIFKAVKKVSR